MWRLVCLLFLLLTGPVQLPSAMAFETIGQSAAAAPSVAATSVAAPAPVAATPVTASDLERRNLILEARSELQNVAYANLELILAGLGVLMTVVVLFFAINTKDAAVKVAKGEVIEERERFRTMAIDAERQMVEVKRELEEARSERKQLHDELATATERAADFVDVSNEVNKRIDEAFTRILHAERAIGAAVAKAEAASEVIEERKNSMQAGSLEPGAIASSEADGLPLAEKQAKDLTESDFSILISDAAGSGNVQEVYELAVTMRRLLQNASAQAYSLFAGGWALGRLGRDEEAIQSYSEAVERFVDSDDAMARDWVAKSWLNKGVALGDLGRHQKAIDTFDALMDRLGGIDDADIKMEIARALVQKGYQLEHLDKSGDAQAVFDGVVARFDASEAFDTQRQVALALFELAAIAAESGETTEAVTLLRKWGEKQGEFDAEWVNVDPRFDAIREKPTFAALLAEHAREETQDAPT